MHPSPTARIYRPVSQNFKAKNYAALNLLRKVNRIFKNNSANFQGGSRSTKRAKRDEFFRPKLLNCRGVKALNYGKAR